MSKELRVIFQPSGRNTFVLPGTVLLEAAAGAGFIIETPCGGAGKCGKCRVRITAGHVEASEPELRVLGEKRVNQGYRLACRCRVNDNLTVEIPQTSLFQSGQKILAHGVGGKVPLQPRTVRKSVRLTASQTVAGQVQKAFRPAEVELDPFVSDRLSKLLEASGAPITLTAVDGRIVDAEAGEPAGPCCGIAFDIGTTTLVGTLMDLGTGEDLAVASMVNPQTSYGDDVISRIKKCREEKNGLRDLQRTVLDAVNGLIAQMLKETGIDGRFVYETVFSGNTAMQQILCGIDPSALGEIPFTAAFHDPLRKRAADLGLGVNPRGDVHVFPQIGGFVGGDTVAGILATKLDRADSPSLLVDVGTNGEIVLCHEGRLTATSVAAGPAFEGARIINGMRGTTGAIEKAIVADGDLQMNVIGDVKPSGLCGSGLIDLMAELLRLGVVDETGRILGADEWPASLPPAVRERVVEHDGQFRVLLASKEESATGEPLYLYQKDIRELQLAKGAIRSGINILLRMENLADTDLKAILLAGGFGNFIRRNNARRIGLLPPIPCDRIRFVGNTALFGAKRVLLSRAEEEYAARASAATRHIDLSLDPAFQAEFSDAMFFPGPDAGL